MADYFGAVLDSIASFTAGQVQNKKERKIEARQAEADARRKVLEGRQDIAFEDTREDRALAKDDRAELQRLQKKRELRADKNQAEREEDRTRRLKLEKKEQTFLNSERKRVATRRTVLEGQQDKTFGQSQTTFGQEQGDREEKKARDLVIQNRQDEQHLHDINQQPFDDQDKRERNAAVTDGIELQNAATAARPAEKKQAAEALVRTQQFTARKDTQNALDKAIAARTDIILQISKIRQSGSGVPVSAEMKAEQVRLDDSVKALQERLKSDELRITNTEYVRRLSPEQRAEVSDNRDAIRQFAEDGDEAGLQAAQHVAALNDDPLFREFKSAAILERKVGVQEVKVNRLQQELEALPPVDETAPDDSVYEDKQQEVADARRALSEVRGTPAPTPDAPGAEVSLLEYAQKEREAGASRASRAFRGFGIDAYQPDPDGVLTPHIKDFLDSTLGKTLDPATRRSLRRGLSSAGASENPLKVIFYGTDKSVEDKFFSYLSTAKKPVRDNIRVQRAAKKNNEATAAAQAGQLGGLNSTTPR